MSEPVMHEAPQTETAPQNDKEYNFGKIRQQLEAEKAQKAQLMQEVQELKKIAQERMYKPPEDDDDSDEPYIDKKALKKHLTRVTQETKQETASLVNEAVQRALGEERRANWLKTNADFYEVMGHAQKFAERDPELAETILEMPDTFERQKLVYKNIKALGLHKKEEPVSNIQDTVDRNRRSPFQPSGMSGPPYAAQGDFSPTGMKTSFDKMKELQKRLGVGG